MSHRESDVDCPQGADAAAYVLGALEEHEAQRYREHLETCAHCRAEVAELQVVVDVLPATAPPAIASEALRERILASVRAEAELLRAAAGRDADKPVRSIRRPWYRRNDFVLGVGAAAAAGVAALVAVLIAVGSSSPGKLTVWHGKPEAAARGAQVSLRERDGHAELVVGHMPPPALGRIYEVWLTRKTGAPQPTNALFSVTSTGSAAVDVSNDLRGVTQVMVTSEPAGGSQHPTTRPLIRVNLRRS